MPLAVAELLFLAAALDEVVCNDEIRDGAVAIRASESNRDRLAGSVEVLVVVVVRIGADVAAGAPSSVRLFRGTNPSGDGGRDDSPVAGDRNCAGCTPRS